MHEFINLKKKLTLRYLSASKTKTFETLVLEGDQRSWWMDGRWCYYSKYWTNRKQENGCGCTVVSVCSCISMHVDVCMKCCSCQFCTPRLSLTERCRAWSDLFGVVTHLFLTNRMATSTSSIKTSTPALIPAIFTTRSVCLAGSGITSGSSVAPTI